MEDANAEVSATLEDYLEAILTLSRKTGGARARDIANTLRVHKSTVTAALKNLSDKGLINYSPYEITTLTPEGEEIAQGVTNSHRIIHDFLTDVLLIDDKVAEKNACRLEHDVDEQVLDRLVLFAEFVKTHPRTGSDWLDRFGSYARETDSDSRRPA